MCAQADLIASVREPPEPPADGIPMMDQNNGRTINSGMAMSGFDRGYDRPTYPKHHVSNIHNIEWRIVASVIDRIFFLIYVIAIILSLVFVFPR